MSTNQTAMTIFVALLFCTAYTSVHAQEFGTMFADVMGGQNIDPSMIQSALADQSVWTKGQAIFEGMSGDIQKQAIDLKAAYEGGESLDSLAKKTMESQSLDQMSEIAAKVKNEAANMGVTVPESMKDVDMAKLKSKAEEGLANGIPANVMEAAKKALTVKPATKPPSKTLKKKKTPKKTATTPKKKTG